ncbi:serine hydrolase domain-containing protein [Arenimonas sp.]|uniref:serine hydrolase domain-containing protein n=1 Tax=Arenimonas sp. TaxID=1872635 RepID=UPI0025C1D396|nr:serine hydrolase domain-containing protein [Arenimonas sp.]
MTSLGPLHALTLAILALSSAPSVPAAPDPGQRSQRLLDELVDITGVPGMGAAIWQGGRITWRGSAGWRDLAAGTPVDADTRFRLASVSKLVAVAAAARLAEDGKLDLDAPVAALWEGVDPEWPALSVRQLAAHTAGVPHYQDRDADRGSVAYATAREAAGLVRGRQLLSAPGERYHYSSWGYTLMSAVIEARSGQRFPEYVTRHVTRDLAIGVDGDNRSDPRATRTYQFEGGRPTPAPAHDSSYTWAGGGYSGTPSAVAEFGGRMMAGDIVPVARFQAMLEPARLNDGREVRDDDYAIGLGWRTLTDQDGRRRAQHAGVTLGARSALVTWPDLPAAEQTAVSLLSNTLWVSSIEQSASMLAAPHMAVPADLVPAGCPVHATRYEGRFRGQPIAGTVTFAVEDGICIGKLSLAGDAKAYFDAFPQKDASHLRVISLDAGTGLSRAALVAPTGLYDLRAQPDGSHRAPLGSSSELRVNFLATRP